jgi:DNA (cytosine-5)-methyltransferase 1
LTHISLFSGIGGIDLAAHWAGFRTVAFVERDPFCQKVLAKRFPNTPIYDDIRTFSWPMSHAEGKQDRRLQQSDVSTDAGASRERVTLVSGGFPCQPFSVAGKRKGAGDERFLWHEMLRVVREVQPLWVLGENVRGLLSIDGGRTFGTILHELAEVGYRVGWGVYGACHVGAPHRRERVFIVAHSAGVRRKGRTGREPGREAEEGRLPEPCPRGEDVAGAGEPGPQGHGGLCERAGEWLAWKGGFPLRGIWKSEPPVGRVASGIPARVDRLRALGNAVVPQQVYPILKAIAEVP